MQTFLPHPNFHISAKALDYQRLGKQRVEAWQIYRALCGQTAGWRNHPSTRMWAGHELSLLHYGSEMCLEWARRGYVDNMLPRFREAMSVLHLDGASDAPPQWIGNEAFHSSHRAALLFKNPNWYGQFNWLEQPKLDYVWPTSNG